MNPINPEWLKQFDKETVNQSNLLVQFLEECEHADISCELENKEPLEDRRLMVHMTVKKVEWSVFGIWIDGTVEIPWSLPMSDVDRKEKFRPFAEALPHAIPGANAYESGEYWNVCVGEDNGKRDKKKGDRSVEISELLGAHEGVLEALSGLHALPQT
jgi:hypothetical protein